MIRRSLLAFATVLTVSALVGLKPATVAAKTGCACCGASCACSSCTCDAQAKLSKTGCDCCGGSTCCPVAAETIEACCH